LTLVLFEY